MGSFNIYTIGIALVDKIGKDTNFRVLTMFDNVLYYTKGSGGNGVNTVYFVDPTARCARIAWASAFLLRQQPLPTSPLAYNPDPAVIHMNGLDPNNMCILNGFPTATKTKPALPFGI